LPLPKILSDRSDTTTKKRFLIVLILLLVGGLLWFFLWRDARKAPADRLQVSGNIEVTEVALSFKIAGRVLSRFAAEGERVARDQVVALLDAADLEHEVALKKAELAAANAQLAEFQAGFRTEEVAQAKAALAASLAEAQNAKENFERQQRLFRENVIPEKEYDAAVTAHRVAVQALREAEERLALQERGNRPEQIARAQAQVDQAEAALASASTRFNYATLRSPLTGIVLTENIEPGEYVQPGTPVITVGNIEEVWLRAYINETDLGRVKVGQEAWLVTDTYSDKQYRGRVTFIASEAEFTPRQVQTDRQRVKLVYRIKITAPNPQMELKPGMPADAIIMLREPSTAKID
jgi:HlyD family secretion protein